MSADNLTTEQQERLARAESERLQVARLYGIAAPEEAVPAQTIEIGYQHNPAADVAELPRLTDSSSENVAPLEPNSELDIPALTDPTEISTVVCGMGANLVALRRLHVAPEGTDGRQIGYRNAA